MVKEPAMLVDRDQVVQGQEGDAPDDTTTAMTIGVIDPPITEQTGVAN